MDGSEDSAYASKDAWTLHGSPNLTDTEKEKTPLSRRVVDSFKRASGSHASGKNALAGDGKVFDVEGAAAATAESPLARKLKGRHLQMIAIGGSIGMFWVEPASALERMETDSGARDWALRWRW